MSKLMVVVLTASAALSAAACGGAERPRASAAEVTSAKVSGSKAMHGIYRTQGETATFQECGSNQILAVERSGGEYEFLAQRYQQLKRPEREVVADVVVHMEQRAGSAPMLVVERVDRLATGKGTGCGEQP